jgi:hypothetical protein
VVTSHYLYIDIDFWPSADMHDILRKNKYREVLSADWRQGIVVPAFDRIPVECNPSSKDCEFYTEMWKMSMPKSKRDLTKLIQEKKVHVFERFNKAAHGSTNANAWLRQGTDVRDIHCVKSNR